MKECERISDFYGELHDRQLSSHLQEETLEHFRTCTDCREDFKWYSITVRALNHLEEVPAPEDFVAQLSAKLYARPTPRFYDTYLEYIRNFLSSSPHLPLPVGAATLAFLVAVGIVMYNHSAVDYIPQAASMQAVRGAGHTQPDAMVAVSDAGGMGGSAYHLTRPQIHASEPTLPSSTARPSFHSAAIPKSLETNVQFAGAHLNTLADRIGGDNLTVESPSVDVAVESVKRILPNISGRLVEEKTPGKFGEKVIGIRIPSSSYGHLTTELINHGAVAAGVGSQASTPAPSKADAGNLILYIHFVQSP